MSEFDLILALLTHPAGYDIDLFGMMCVRSLDDGRFAVTYNEMWGVEDYKDKDGKYKKKLLEKGWERLYKDPRRAVRFFLKKRNELKLGIDHEIELNKHPEN